MSFVAEVVVNKKMSDAVPTAMECRELMASARLPAGIMAHCRVVAEISRRLALAVNNAGGRLDVDCIYAAALVHDIARVEHRHADRGADLLESLGYARLLADIVRTHMDIVVDDRLPVDEREIVYLADKMVCGERVVGLEERFRRALQKCGVDIEAAAAVRRRQSHACRIRDRVEAAVRLTLAEICDITVADRFPLSSD